MKSCCSVETYPQYYIFIIFWLNNLLVPMIGYVIDFSFKLSSSLEPRTHIDILCRKTLKVFRLVMRSTYDFTLKTRFKTLLCALVRSTQLFGTHIQLIALFSLRESNDGFWGMQVLFLTFFAFLMITFLSKIILI